MPTSPDSSPNDVSQPPADLTFFEAFAWAVPSAFASALAAHRFEQGDVLFPERAAYGALEGSFAAGARAIQVLAPPRSARVTTPAEFEGNRRRSSWESEVEIELVDLASGATESKRLSQGKLLMALWRGDEAWLDPAREEPPLPRSGRELASRLDQARGAFDAAQSTRKGCRFVFVVDLASDSSRVKAEAVEDALGALGELERIELAPVRAGIAEAETFHPALVLRALVVRGASAAAMEKALRAALYGGGPSKSTSEDDESPTTDRFSVARHGLLEELDG